MCSTPALIKSVFLPERCMEHSLWGQVHQAKSISFYPISSALSKSSNPADRMSEPAQMRGRENGGTGKSGIGYGSVKWRHSPAAWPSYNIKATIIKWSNTVGLHVSVPQRFHKAQPWNAIIFFPLLFYWSLLLKKNMFKMIIRCAQCVKTTCRAGSSKTHAITKK